MSDPATRAEQRVAAEHWSAQFAAAPGAGIAPRRISRRRLRVGYLSSDYFDHPTAVLTAGLFERHDRSRFEIVGYSMGPNDGSALRGRVVAGTTEALELIYQHIARNYREGVRAPLRIAPVEGFAVGRAPGNRCPAEGCAGARCSRSGALNRAGRQSPGRRGRCRLF